jgi:2',3'-cyclic-nucleotide 2'-phosphodiesterase (5'-nucleotidase family)
VLDTGDALVGGGVLGDATQGEVIVAAMSYVGTDAMALGPQELSLGSAVLLKRLDEADFPMLSANVLVAGTRELFAPAYKVLEAAGHRIGIIGLTRKPTDPVPDFEVEDPVSTAATVVPEVSRQAETVILLTNLDYRSAMSLAAAVPGIDLVVAAEPSQLPQDAVVVPGTGALIVVAEQPLAGHTGRRVGRLAVTIMGDGSLTNPAWRSVPLDSTFADDPQMKALLDRFRK